MNEEIDDIKRELQRRVMTAEAPTPVCRRAVNPERNYEREIETIEEYGTKEN